MVSHRLPQPYLRPHKATLLRLRHLTRLPYYIPLTLLPTLCPLPPSLHMPHPTRSPLLPPLHATLPHNAYLRSPNLPVRLPSFIPLPLLPTPCPLLKSSSHAPHLPWRPLPPPLNVMPPHNALLPHLNLLLLLPSLIVLPMLPTSHLFLKLPPLLPRSTWRPLLSPHNTTL